MSHYTVAVLTKDDNPDLDFIMSPYDENRQVAPYVSSTREQIIQREREYMQSLYDSKYSEWLRDPDAYETRCNNPQHIEALKALPDRMKRSDEEIYQAVSADYGQEEITEDGSVLSTYNPHSKWDWYSIGGRWQGMLLLKPGKMGKKGKAEFMCEIGNDYDSALVSDVDFDEMKHQQKLALAPYEQAIKNNLYKESYMRERYPSEEIYIQRSINFNTYAVVTPDGCWHSAGDMGWFGMSSESADEEADWKDHYFERFLQPGIDNGWYITILDCHI